MRSKIVALSRSTFSSLRQRNFRLYFIGQGVSLTGGWIQSVGQSWLVLHLTGSGMALGIVSALQFAPTLVLGPYAGVLADRLPKRKLLLVTQTVLGLLALVLGIAVATGAVQAWMVYVVAGVLGLVNAIDYPTRQAFLFEMAGPAEVVSAVGLNGTMVNLARVVGPALAGALIALWGMGSTFLINAASFIAVLGCLLMMRPAELYRLRREKEPGGLAEGLAYAAGAPMIRSSLLMMAVIGVLTYEFSVTLPLLVKFTFHGSAADLAYLMSAMGLGAVIGGLVTASRRGDGLGRLSVAALIFGAATALVGLAPTFPIALVAMFGVGVFSARFTGLSNGILQTKSESRMRSRMLALWSTAFMGSTFIGAPLLGWAGELGGARVPLVIGALGGLIAAVIGLLGRREQISDVRALQSCRQVGERAA